MIEELALAAIPQLSATIANIRGAFQLSAGILNVIQAMLVARKDFAHAAPARAIPRRNIAKILLVACQAPRAKIFFAPFLLLILLTMLAELTANC
jgi:hypothetical protein